MTATPWAVAAVTLIFPAAVVGYATVRAIRIRRRSPK